MPAKGGRIIDTTDVTIHSAVRVNGEMRPLAGPTLDPIFCAPLAIDAARRGIAIAVDGTVVPRARWDSTLLRGGEDIEIVRPPARRLRCVLPTTTR